MRRSIEVFSAVLALLATNALAWGSDDASAMIGAEELNPTTFQKFIDSTDVAMIDFYAPWCGHCTRFAPKFDAAAKDVAAKRLNAKLGKLDCTTHSRFCDEKAIRAYPTMKIYKHGGELYHEYTGPRRTAAVVEFVEKQVLPSITRITSKQSLDSFLEHEQSEVVLIGYIDPHDEASEKKFSAAAEKLHEDFPLGLVTDAGVAKQMGIDHMPTIVLHMPWKEGTIGLNREFEVEAIKDFALKSYTPLVGELDGENFDTYTTGAPTAFFFIKSDDSRRRWANMLKPVSKNNKMKFAIADANEFAMFADFLAVADNGFPSMSIWDPSRKQKFAYNTGTGPLSSNNIESFVRDFLAGRVPVTVKSEPVPNQQDGPVTKVVAKNFDQIVMDPTKDVLIFFGREDCPYCRALNPTWWELGKLFKAHRLTDQVVIAAVEASKNELNERPNYVPYIMLYKAGDKQNPVVYDGNRSIDDLVNFVKHWSTHGTDAHAVATPEQPIIDHKPIMHGQSPMHYRDEL